MAILKWILGGLGWAMVGPLGGIIGYFIGDAISSKRENIRIDSGQSTRRGPYHNTGTRDDVNVALLVLIAAVMKADNVAQPSQKLSSHSLQRPHCTQVVVHSEHLLHSPH